MLIIKDISHLKLYLKAYQDKGHSIGYVERNRAKRRTREAIRTGGLIDSLQGVQFILILKKTVLKVPFIDLKQEIEKFLKHEK